MVAIYPEPLSESLNDTVTLIFPGVQANTSPQRVTTKRLGDTALFFETPSKLLLASYS